MQVFDLADLRVGGERECILTGGAEPFEGRRQRGESLCRRLCPDQFVVRDSGFTISAGDRHNGPLECAVAPGLGSLVLGFDAVRIQLVAGVPLDRGIQVGGNTHMDGTDLRDSCRVGPQRSSITEHRSPGDTFDATGHDEGHVVAANAGRALADCVDAGCAETVEGCAGDGVAPTGKECGSSRDVRALLVHLRCATENDVVDLFCGEVRSTLQSLGQVDDKIDWAVFVEGASRRCSTARRSHVVEDKSISHFQPFN